MQNKPVRDQIIARAKRCVVKIGSALLTQDGKGLDYEAIADWAEQIVHLKKQGIEIILVSSGAVAEGMTRMGWTQRPKALYELQAAAAIGQMGLIQAYEANFSQHQYHAAQILLTHDDLDNRRRYLNARNTLHTLLKLDAIPIVNENDSVSYDEIQLGDNDTLGALVANLIDADLYIILTDQQGLFDQDPRHNPDAKLIREAQANDKSLVNFAGSAGTVFGTGGMLTKVTAAQRAAQSGCPTIIASGRERKILERIYAQENLGTLLLADTNRLAARKQWLAGQLKSRGTLWLDQGAVTALTATGKSLLAIGVTKVDGNFQQGDMVTCMDTTGQVIAKGLINYASDETVLIKGKNSSEFTHILGFSDRPELIHRNNLVVY
jgi:glutamate 5-kinase